MKSVDLLTEFRLAVEAVDQPHTDRMAALSVGYDLMDDLSPDGMMPFGVASIVATDGNLFEPSSGDDLRVIQPVCGGAGIVDLVAWTSADPTSWRLRTGLGAYLGDLDELIESTRWSPETPVVLHRTPLDWLRAGGDGLCVINWGAPELRDLHFVPDIIATDIAVAEELRAVLSRPIRLPRITVAERMNNAA